MNEAMREAPVESGERKWKAVYTIVERPGISGAKQPARATLCALRARESSSCELTVMATASSAPSARASMRPASSSARTMAGVYDLI